MSGKKGKVHYSGEMKEQVRKEIGAGKSQCEVSRKYGISRYAIQGWCGLRPETKLWQIVLLPKGRPRKIRTLEARRLPEGKQTVEDGKSIAAGFSLAHRKDVHCFITPTMLQITKGDTYDGQRNAASYDRSDQTRAKASK